MNTASSQPSGGPHHALLTKKERQVVALLLKRAAPAVIAERLSISVYTVRAHIRAIHLKTETHDMVSLVMWGLLHLDCCVSPPNAPAHSPVA